MLTQADIVLVTSRGLQLPYRNKIKQIVDVLSKFQNPVFFPQALLCGFSKLQLRTQGETTGRKIRFWQISCWARGELTLELVLALKTDEKPRLFVEKIKTDIKKLVCFLTLANRTYQKPNVFYTFSGNYFRQS